MPDFPPRTEFLLLDTRIIPFVIFTIISKLDPRMACGLDGIAVIVLKKYSPELALVLSKFYNIGSQPFLPNDPFTVSQNVMPSFSKIVRLKRCIPNNMIYTECNPTKET